MSQRWTNSAMSQRWTNSVQATPKRFVSLFIHHCCLFYNTWIEKRKECDGEAQENNTMTSANATEECH